MEYWMVEKCTIDCPFCGKNIVTDYERKYECAKDDVPEDGAIIIDGDDCYRNLSSCEHMAYFGIASQDILEADEKYVKIFIDIAKTINTIMSLDYDDEDLENEYTVLISEYFDEINWKAITRTIKKKNPKIELASESCYVESGDGPHGGGPTYQVVFLKS